MLETIAGSCGEIARDSKPLRDSARRRRKRLEAAGSCRKLWKLIAHDRNNGGNFGKRLKMAGD
eukprot:1892060-Alexandrium_andersonii.AAC.1